MIMKTMQTLMLVAATVLSLGAGAARAQGEMPSAAEGAYFSGQHQSAPQTTNTQSGQVQSGSSDVTPDPRHQFPNWRDLPNYTDPG
jgi:hypothetical protein